MWGAQRAQKKGSVVGVHSFDDLDDFGCQDIRWKLGLLSFLRK